jgi:hypothetical protein
MKAITNQIIKIQKLPLIEIVNLGWKVLVEKLGPVGAARFFRAIHSDKGNSLKEIKDMWKGKERLLNRFIKRY